MSNMRPLRALQVVCALILSAVASPNAHADGYEACKGGYLWDCACGASADGGPAMNYCHNTADDVDCHLNECLWSPSNGPTGYYVCCSTGLRCTDSDGAITSQSGACSDLGCPIGSACHDPNDICGTGTCIGNAAIDGQGNPTVTNVCATDGGTDCGQAQMQSQCNTLGGTNPYAEVGSTPGGAPSPASEFNVGAVGGPATMNGVLASARRTSQHQFSLVNIPGTISAFGLNAYFVSSDKTWGLENSLGRLDEPFLPKPFGASPSWAGSLHWWHDYYTFVYPRGWTANQSTWSVRDGKGELIDFIACSDGTISCFATPAPSSAETTSKLYWQAPGSDAGSFIFYATSGRRYYYADTWIPTDGGVGERYFLSRVEDAQYSTGTPRTIATLAYAVPDAGSCPGLSSGTNGVPYIHHISDEDGAELRFHYAELPSVSGAASNECVLTSVALADDPHGNPNAETPVVQFAYAAAPDGGSTPVAGNLASTTWTQSNATQSYKYYDATPVFEITENGYQALKEQFGTSDPQLDATGVSSNGSTILGTNSDTVMSCDAGFSEECQDATEKNVWFAAGRGYDVGDAQNVLVHLLLEYDALGGRARTKAISWSCNSGQSCSGTETWDWTQLSSGSVVSKGRKDKRDSWTAYDQEVSSIFPTGTGLRTPTELLASYNGATDENGTGALERTDYAYEYGGTGQAPQAYEQSVKTVTEPSVLNPTGSAVTTNVHDPSTNRLKAVIRSGYSSSFDGTAWTTAPRYVGTFYFTNHKCQDDSDDPLGRVLEVHGPCFVSGTSAQDCDVDGEGGVPITQYFYFPAATGNNNANRLQKVSRLTSNGGPDSCFGANRLETTYDNYDSHGEPGVVMDPNGVTTVYTYQDGRVTSVSIDGNTTTYFYDFGKLSAVQHPEGNYEIFCHSTTGYSASCQTGNGWWRPVVGWERKSPSISGSAFSEAMTLGYGAYGQLITEQFALPSPGIVSERSFGYDNENRQTVDAAGRSVSSGYGTRRLFDGANNLTGIGFPFNLAPALCGGADSNGEPLSPLCAALSYDRANRLIGLDERPASTDAATRTCLSYDAQGNVSSIKSGCGATGTPGDCSTCSAPATTYQYDDFGNVVAVTAPWTSDGTGGPGTAHFSYDAYGNVLVKQTPAMMVHGDYLEHGYDLLGRELSLMHSYSQPSPGREVLYATAYDNAGALDASCPQPANALGRPLYRVDSFGQTWFQYDHSGRVTEEIRLRDGSTTCSTSTPNANPDTLYSYSPNGNLTSITYPYGRKVTYTYGVYGGTAITTDRVSSISVSTWDGTQWLTQPDVISHIAWEPYGGLRGYEITHPTTGTSSSVEYFRGDITKNPPSPSCPTSVPATNGDFTGLTRSVWVSAVADGGSYVPGTGNGAVLKQTYTYTGDQVTQVDTCLLGATTAETENYSYDEMLRVKGASRPVGNEPDVGGVFTSRAYAYDGRGNRTGETREDCAYADTYGNAAAPDQLTSQASACAGSVLRHEYSYDEDGRVSSKSWANDSSGGPAFQEVMKSADIGQGANGALESVFNAVTVNGAAYNYFYDALNRRRLKVYPTGASDEYFYDAQNELIVDQGNDSVIAASFHPDDDYVWLGGRPVIVIRGKLDNSWARQSDFSSDCARNDATAPCGMYFPVTDALGKPILVLDGSRRVTAALDYDVFGQPNRVSLDKETAHPYAAGGATLSDFTQPVGGMANPSTSVSVRVLFDVVDTDSASDAYTYLVDGDTSAVLSARIGGPHLGKVWTPWVYPSAGHIQVDFSAASGGDTGLGIVMAGYEYERFQTGAIPFALPVRFPGQYYDPETDLFQNWNRFYDPNVGRYFEPEPLLQNPNAPQLEAGQGYSMPVYSYVNGNPMANSDANGLFRRETKNVCPNYSDALELAKEMVCPHAPAPTSCQDGRTPHSGGTFGGNRCQKAQRQCNICAILEDGSGPGLTWDTDFCYGHTSPDRKHVRFCQQICRGGDNVYELALTLIHEAEHTCGGSECQARQVEEACGGNVEAFNEPDGALCLPYPLD